MRDEMKLCYPNSMPSTIIAVLENVKPVSASVADGASWLHGDLFKLIPV